MMIRRLVSPRVGIGLLIGLLAVLAVGVLCGHLGLGGAKSSTDTAGGEPPRSVLPPLRAAPLSVEPVDLPSQLVPEEDLRRGLKLLGPYWQYRRAGDALHALRLWGPGTVFPDQPPYPVPHGVRVWQPREMLDLYLHERSFQDWFRGSQPYFFPSPHGLGERRADDPAATLHYDNFLHLAAELGLPLDTPLHWAGRRFTLVDLFTHSFAWFHPDQELEFTAIAYALYLEPPAAWTNRFGDRYDLDSVTERLVERDLLKCTCYATHVPYALAVVLAADRKQPILSPRVRQRARDRIRKLAAALEESQSGAGWWDRKWSPELRAKEATEPEEVEWIRSTGHHLEWIALALPELRPNADCIRRTVRFLLTTLGSLEPWQMPQAYYFNACSHAARALVLFTGRQRAGDLVPGQWPMPVWEPQGGK